MSKATSNTKLWFNRKDVQNNPVLKYVSPLARCVYYELAFEAAGCARPGHLTDQGKALGIPEIAALARMTVDEAGAAVRELIERGAIVLSKAGVLIVKMVEKAWARACKNSESARKQYQQGQGNFFEPDKNLRRAGGDAENNVKTMRYERKRRAQNPPYIPPCKNKNIFYSLAPVPRTREEAQAENCERITDRALKWWFLGDVVKLRRGEFDALCERFSFGGAEAWGILQRHDEYMQGQPAERQELWRRFLIAHCTRLSKAGAWGKEDCSPREHSSRPSPAADSQQRRAAA